MRKINLDILFVNFARFLIVFYFVAAFVVIFQVKNQYFKKQEMITPIFLNFIGSELDDDKKHYYEKANPFGFILIKENIKTYEQTKKLVKDLRDLFPNRKVYIAIDQEGGRVDRLRHLVAKDSNLIKSARYYGDFAKKDLNKAKELIYQDSKFTAKTLKDLGIDINFAPMLDLMYDNANNISDSDATWSATEDRSYSSNIKITIELGREFMRAMHEEGIFAAPKHIPGIGRGFTDTHDGESIIDADEKLLTETDFLPFKELAHLSDFAMVGHATYTKIDNKNPATMSQEVINKIRGENIGFSGLLVSDALNMKAVSDESYQERIDRCLQAGIDIVIPNYTHLSFIGPTINSIDKDIIKKFNEKLKKFEKNNILGIDFTRQF